jgi:hypothetical protein
MSTKNGSHPGHFANEAVTQIGSDAIENAHLPVGRSLLDAMPRPIAIKSAQTSEN